MIVNISNEIRVTNPSQTLVKWVKKNLIIPNPEYQKKARMNLWLGNTKRELSLFEMDGDVLVLPYGVLTMFTPEIANEFSTAIQFTEFVETRRIDYNADIPLYDYQEKAVTAMIESGSGILQSPAGSGKTQMGIALACRLGVRTLWLCHTLDLVQQSKERAKLYIKEGLIGTISEGKVNIGIGITFATVQTMAKLNLDKYKNYFDCIITDEVHRVSGSPTAMTQYQKVLSSLSAPHKYGLSATVHRSDGMIKATLALVGNIAYKVPEEEVADKIMRVGILPLDTGVKIGRACLNSDGTLNYAKMINYITDDYMRLEVVVNAIKLCEGKSCLILSDRLRHLEHMIDWLPSDMQKDSVMISGNMTTKKGKAQREKAIEDMRNGTKKYLFATYALAKEGLDIPRLERLFLTTPQKDYAIVTQSIGRVARTFEGKKDAIAYDFVDDMPHAVKSYKKRCTIYRKNNCYFVGDNS